MSNAFHNKFHRKNHSTYKNPSVIDSGWDPIASVESPFQGDLVLSASNNPAINGLALSSNEASIFATLNTPNAVCLNLSADNVEMIGGSCEGSDGISIGQYATSKSRSFVFAPVSISPSVDTASDDSVIFDTDGSIFLRGPSDIFITSGDSEGRGIVFKTSNNFTPEQKDVRFRIETDSISGNFLSVKENDGVGNWVGTTKIFNDGLHTTNLSTTSAVTTHLTVSSTLTLPNSSITSNMITGNSISLDKLAFSLTNETSGKAEKDFSNVSTTALSTLVLANSGKVSGPDYVIETYKSADNLSWYRKYASGWIEQGTRVSLNGITSATATFPTPFNVICLEVTASPTGASSSYIVYTDPTPTLTSILVRTFTSTSNLSANIVAYGY